MLSVEPHTAESARARSDESLVRTYHQGSPRAADELYRRYADRLRDLARRHISRGLAARVDADDIVQSVFRRFFHAAKEGRYQSPSGGELWELLLASTVNRVRTAEAYHRAEKRDLAQTVGWEPSDSATAPGDGLDAALNLAVDEVLDLLPEAHREVIRLRMDGNEVAEIAAALSRSKRTVERTLQEARERLRSLLELDG